SSCTLPSIGHPPYTHPLPTRRSSDLVGCSGPTTHPVPHCCVPARTQLARRAPWPAQRPRCAGPDETAAAAHRGLRWPRPPATPRSEEHTSELQSRENLVCRLLLEKKN